MKTVNKDKYIHKFCEDLCDIQKTLKQACHVPSCKKYLQCPKQHAQCRDILNHKTAAYWCTAEIITYVVDRTRHHFDSCDMDFYHSYLDKISTIRNVLEYHLPDNARDARVYKSLSQLTTVFVRMFCKLEVWSNDND